MDLLCLTPEEFTAALHRSTLVGCRHARRCELVFGPGRTTRLS